jgi:tetratricopeptide (TPR) repeat protein
VRAPVALLLLAPLAANAADLATQGLCAYANGRYGEAVTVLRQSLRDEADGASSGMRAYFLGRSLHESGLGVLAAPWLRRAEAATSAPWRPLARRELARLEFEAGDRASLLELYGKSDGAEVDPEVAYLTGLAVAQQGDWLRAVWILDSVASTSRYHPYARYARAQAEAAAGRFDDALTDLAQAMARSPLPHEARPARLADRELLQPLDAEFGMLRIGFVDDAPGVSLHDRAALLTGKIHYVHGRRAQARTAFAAVRGGGATGLDALRGLLLTGGAPPSADLSPPGPDVFAAAVLMANAAAAADRHEFAAEWHYRLSLQNVARARMAMLRRLATNEQSRRSLANDLATFTTRARRAHARERWSEEQPSLPISCSVTDTEPGQSAFHPSDDTFYGVWEAAQAQPAAAALLQLLAAGRALAVDIEAPLARLPFWEVWRTAEDPHLHYALLVARVTAHRLRLTRYAERFGGLAPDVAEIRRHDIVDRALQDVGELYAARAPNDPDTRLTSQIRLREEEISDAKSSVTGDATDMLIEFVGDRIDTLAGRRPAGGDIVASTAAVAARLRMEVRAAQTDIARWLQPLIEAHVRSEMAFLQRVDADNQAAIARVYARLSGEKIESDASTAKEAR